MSRAPRLLTGVLCLCLLLLLGNTAAIAGSSMPIQQDESSDQSTLTAAERQQVIQQLSSELRAKYVFPKTGEQMAVAVEKSLENGDYDSIETRQAFAEALTDELRSICHDLHLRVRPGSPSRRVGGGRPPSNQHFGFVRAEYLEGNVGYLKFNGFAGGSEAQEVAGAAMNFLSGSKALIFDLRENGGGSPDMIEFLCGYLFDEKVHLNSFYNRPTDTTTTTWSREDVPGHRFGNNMPVFVLTSQRTFSAAEEFTYDLKHLKRATIVGEVTGGGAHPVMPVTLGPHLFMTMPFARAINPITDTNWEGVGVKPHLEVSASEALDAALKLAHEQLASKRKAAVDGQDDAQAMSAAELFQVADGLVVDQKFSEAAAVFRQVTTKDDGQARAWFMLGYCLHMDGKLDEAITAHARAATFESFAADATYNLACAYALQGETEKALNALDDAIERGYDNANQIELDSDLDSLRGDERFQAMLEKIK